MITYLPYTDFAQCASVLRHKHLRVARLDAYRVIRELFLGEASEHKDDPVVLMWRGFGLPLVAYTLAMCDEWKARGFEDQIREKLLKEVAGFIGIEPDTLEGMCHQDVQGGYGERHSELPYWLGREELHASHRSELLRQDRTWYEQFGWEEDVSLPLFWPVQVGETETHQTKEEEMPEVAESSQENMNREGVVDALRGAGYDGPVSYNKSKLLEMLDVVKGGGTIDTPRRGRKPREASDDKEGTPAAE